MSYNEEKLKGTVNIENEEIVRKGNVEIFPEKELINTSEFISTTKKEIIEIKENLDNSKLKKEWDNYLTILNSKLYNKSISYHSANIEELLEFEEKIKIKLPREFIELYLIINGDSKEFSGLILGLDFLSIDKVYETWENWVECAVDETFNEFVGLGSVIKSTIKINYANVLWIPIVSDGSGNHFGFDLDPDISGIKGQIINFGRDEELKLVYANDIILFIRLMSEYLKNNKFFFKEKDNCYRLYIGEEENTHHAIDELERIFNEHG